MQGSEGRLEGIKKQLGQDLKREAHLSAEAEAHKKSIAERDQALRLAAQEVRSSALPNGALAQSAVQKYASRPSCSALLCAEPTLRRIVSLVVPSFARDVHFARKKLALRHMGNIGLQVELFETM